MNIADYLKDWMQLTRFITIRLEKDGELFCLEKCGEKRELKDDEAIEGHKLDNILSNSKVSFCVVGKTCTLPDKFSTKYESVIIFGREIEVFDNEKNIVLLEILNKYSPDYMRKGEIYITNARNKNNY